MNVLFLTIGKVDGIEERGLYTDLFRCFRDHGHKVYIVCAREKREKSATEFIEDHGVHILRTRTGNITKCGIIEKGISTLMIEGQFLRGIKKFLSNIIFDLIIYSTPPITFSRVVKHIKKRDNAKSYLLLKDIFPQNAVDIGLMTTKGVKGLIYKYFRKKERALYTLSDYIGCMSKANVDYILAHNPEIESNKVEICPNSVEPRDFRLDRIDRDEMRKRYGIPLNKRIFVYGGNLGKPQGIPFIIRCLLTQLQNDESFFLIVGDGTEYETLRVFFEKYNPKNMKLMKHIPKVDYDKMIGACDIGMVFLDYRFTIPNFPSRLLSYMQAGLPVLACTDLNTDIGDVIAENGFGWWCGSNDVNGFFKIIKECSSSNLRAMGAKGFEYLRDEYSTYKSYEIITEKLR